MKAGLPCLLVWLNSGPRSEVALRIEVNGEQAAALTKKGLDSLDGASLAPSVTRGMGSMAVSEAALFVHTALDGMEGEDLADPVHAGLDAMSAADVATPVKAGLDTLARQKFFGAHEAYQYGAIVGRFSSDIPRMHLPNSESNTVVWQMVIPSDWPACSISAIKVICSSDRTDGDDFYV